MVYKVGFAGPANVGKSTTTKNVIAQIQTHYPDNKNKICGICRSYI
jgi:pantothenate kinase